uniref:Myb_DNA-bind_7 domain-containing protein n=1 Tax=Mesocestoides corti TaxID=53468 RepID=A0A5K3ESS7_MESCO
MPRVFKPRVVFGSSQNQQKSRVESKTSDPSTVTSLPPRSPPQQDVKSLEQQISNVPESQGDINAQTSPTKDSEKLLCVPENIFSAQSPPVQLEKNATYPNLNRSSDVDIDAVCPEESNSSNSSNLESVELFVVKQQPRRHRVVYGEPPPPADKPLDRSTVTLRSLLNWIPTNKPPPRIRDCQLKPKPVQNDLKQVQAPCESEKNRTEESDEGLGNDAKAAHVDPFAPQLCLDAEGNIVLDEQSLEITRPEDTSTAKLRHVAEEAGLYGTTYTSFRRRPITQRGRRWSEKDTTRFYRALSTIGTDFYCMTKLFPDRTRAQLLKKFKREERLFPHLVNEALSMLSFNASITIVLENKRNYDITAFYNSESEPEEKYEKLTEDAIAQKRKAPKEKAELKKVAKRSTCDISSLIEEVLAESVKKYPDGGDDEELTSVSPRKQKITPCSLSEMIEKTAKGLST